MFWHSDRHRHGPTDTDTDTGTGTDQQAQARTNRHRHGPTEKPKDQEAFRSCPLTFTSSLRITTGSFISTLPNSSVSEEWLLLQKLLHNPIHRPTYKTSSFDVENPEQLTHFTLLVSFLNLCSSNMVSLIKKIVIFCAHYMKYHWPCKRGRGVNRLFLSQPDKCIKYIHICISGYVNIPFCTSRHKTPPIQQNHCRPHQPVGEVINTT